jgi:aspartyl/asparaginyl beta-hydroxylase (cupin superfamily)
MQLTNQEAERLVREGVEALRQGRHGEARARLEQVTATGRAGAQIWLLLATACRGEGKAEAAERALDALLKLEPHAVRGLIMKGDCRVAAGDEQAAVLLYGTALRVSDGQDVPPELAAELRRAEAATKAIGAGVASRLEAALSSRGYPDGSRSSRFQQSLDIFAGRRRLFLQEPTLFYYPELPHIAWFDTAPFDWVPALEAATEAIGRELAAAMAERKNFEPYIRSEPHLPRTHPLLDRPDWSALFLAENGAMFDDVIARCPATWAALQAVPLIRIPGFGPTLMFSLLQPRTRIPAHSGSHNIRLTCHLPLIVPPGCGFRVGNETRAWEAGKLLIFDDTIEHEAWNDSDQDRVVLIFDIWRPEFTAREREELTAFFSLGEAGGRPKGG